MIAEDKEEQQKEQTPPPPVLLTDIKLLDLPGAETIGSDGSSSSCSNSNAGDKRGHLDDVNNNTHPQAHPPEGKDNKEDEELKAATTTTTAKAKEDGKGVEAPTEWWVSGATYLGFRRLVSVEAEKRFKKQRNKMREESNSNNSDNNSSEKNELGDSSIPGRLVLFADHIAFVPILSGMEASHIPVLRMPLDNICEVRQMSEPNSDAINILVNSKGTLYLYEFCKVFRATPFYLVLQHFVELPPNNRPKLTPQYLSRIAFPEHGYWERNQGEIVLAVIPKQKTVMTNHRVVFQSIQAEVEFSSIAVMYVSDEVTGGVEIISTKDADGNENESAFRVPNLPVEYSEFLLDQWLSYCFDDLNLGDTKAQNLSPAVRSDVLRVIHRQFGALDINHDGFVYNDELAEALGPVLGPRIEEMLSYLDTNRDGRMSFREFLDAMSTTAFPTEEKKLASTLLLMDLDHNGVLSDDEIVNAVYCTVTRSQVQVALAELRKAFGDPARGGVIPEPVPIERVAQAMLTNPLIRSALNLTVATQAATRGPQQAESIYTVSPITLGHADWVLGTFLLHAVTTETAVRLPAMESQLCSMEKYAVVEGSSAMRSPKARKKAEGTVLLRTHSFSDFHTLRTHFGIESEYFHSLNMDAVFESMVGGQDMGVLDAICDDRDAEHKKSAFSYRTRDGLFIIRSMAREDAEGFIDTLPAYTDHMMKNADSILPKVMSIHSIHFSSPTRTLASIFDAADAVDIPGGDDALPLEIFFMVSLNPLRTMLPITGVYCLRGVPGRVLHGAESAVYHPQRYHESYRFEGDLHHDIFFESDVREKFLKQLEVDADALCKMGFMYSVAVATTTSNKHTKPDLAIDLSRFSPEEADVATATTAAASPIKQLKRVKKQSVWKRIRNVLCGCCSSSSSAVRTNSNHSRPASARSTTPSSTGGSNNNNNNGAPTMKRTMSSMGTIGFSGAGGGLEHASSYANLREEDSSTGMMFERHAEGFHCADPYDPDTDAVIFMFFCNMWKPVRGAPATAVSASDVDEDPVQYRDRLLQYMTRLVKTDESCDGGNNASLFAATTTTSGSSTSERFDCVIVDNGQKAVLELDGAEGMLRLYSKKQNVCHASFPLREMSVVRGHPFFRKSQLEIGLRHSVSRLVAGVSARRASITSHNTGGPAFTTGKDATEDEDLDEFDFCVTLAFLSAARTEHCYNILRRATVTVPYRVLSNVAVGVAKVFIGSWNVGDTVPTSLTPWLSRAVGCDIAVVSSQESCAKAAWISAIAESLADTDFVLLHECSCWDIHLFCLARRCVLSRISHVESKTEATGIGHVLGNKGGVCISLRFDDTSLAFFGAHFAAHLENTSDRNSNFTEILGEVSESMSPTRHDLTNAFHHVFWCGDLNYRIEGPSLDDVIDAADVGAFETLLKYDQLAREMQLGRVFHGFRDAPPFFPPTYKYIPGKMRDGGAVGLERLASAHNLNAAIALRDKQQQQKQQ
eukprot:PhM_4_TR18709/c0_g2_i1/m.7856